MKKTFVRITALLVLLATIFTAQAYDIIKMNNGNTIKARILQVTNTEVRFKKADAPDGPTYTLNKRNIESIDYDYGDTEIVEHNAPKPNNDMWADLQMPTAQNQPVQSVPVQSVPVQNQPVQSQPSQRSSEMFIPAQSQQQPQTAMGMPEQPRTGVDVENFESEELSYLPAESNIPEPQPFTSNYVSEPSYNAPVVDYSYGHGLYNDYSLIYDYPNMGKDAKNCVMTFGVNPGSDIFDDNIEIAFLSGYSDRRDFKPHCKGGKVDVGNNEMLIFVKNKSSRPVYIDLTKSVFKRGDEYVTIYDPTKATRSVINTVELSLDLCSVSNTLRKMINGTNTELNWKEENVTTHSLTNEQTICLKPYSAILITNQFISNEFKSGLPFFINSRNGTGVNLGNGVLREGEAINYSVDNSPLTYSMTVAYSTSRDMDELRTVNSEIFLRSILGLAQYGAGNKVNLDEIPNIDKLTIGHVLSVCHDTKKPQIMTPRMVTPDYMRYY